ncbi:phosphopantetheine-binding protein [Streptomyces orinoci]|uniref:Phosphopantetheine-binding protein n=1 Tax=Streptomyces orinoci TaxID=67339 RepID=A0ABV3K058_STRON|nr:phosphopantetheine-binding protein [Streptomyces orinoci]
MSAGTETEKAVAEAWSVVLKKDGFGMDEDFFAIGGNSMLATVVTYRLRERFGVELPLLLIFEHPTVTELATAIDQIIAGDE